MPRCENSTIAGIVVIDGQSKPIASLGLGTDARIRSLVADEQWMKMARETHC